MATEDKGLGKRTPSDFLKQVLGRPVVVKLNSGVDYRGAPAPSSTGYFPRRSLAMPLAWGLGAGVLAHLDGFMNIAMEQTEEYVNGQLRVRRAQNIHCPPALALTWPGAE